MDARRVDGGGECARTQESAILAGTDPESYARCCEMLAALDLRADLGRVAAPTLVVGGAQDPAFPLEHQRVIAHAIHGAQLAVVEPAAHLANVEQVGAVTDLLRLHFGAGGALQTRSRSPRS